MEPLTEFFVIRNKDGEYYKPSNGKFWKSDMKRAKIYTKIGHAKCAITTKMDQFDSLSKCKWLKPTEEQLHEYSKFNGCEIIKVGFMHPSPSEYVRYTQGKD